jgi:phosphoribosylamine--glycine ligase
LRNSAQVDLLYCAPGNGGIADVAECVSLDVDHHEEVIQFCREKDIGLTVIGPEAPLVDGLANSLADAGHRAFGPSAKAAQLEKDR